MFLAVVVWAEAKAHVVLAQARKELFGDMTPWHGHPMKTHPRLKKWEHHTNYPQYLRVYRSEQRNILRQIGLAGMVAAVLILFSRL